MPKVFAVHKTGFRVELDDIGRDRLEDAINWLLGHGYRPDVSGGEQWQRTPSGEPLCPRHGIAMVKRSKQGDEWFSHRVIHPETGTELFCRGYRTSSENDGFEI